MKFRKSNYGLVLVLVLFGCSSVEITKVPSKTQYSTWGDEQQRRVDSIKGVRYYMPRPYVNVYEPFLVKSTAYIVNGLVSADGSIRLKELKPSAPKEIRELVGIDLAGNIYSGMSRTSDNQGEQGNEEGEQTNEEIPVTPTETVRKAGKSKLSVANDHNAYSITPLRRYYDIVYLPDFDEQYAVSRTLGFGGTTVNVTLGQGWSLQKVDIEVDNSAISNILLDLFEAVTKDALGLLDVKLPSSEAKGDQSREGVSDTREITLKIIKAEYVTPGLYPIAKPREIMELVQSGKSLVNYIIPNFKTFIKLDIQSLGVSKQSYQSSNNGCKLGEDTPAINVVTKKFNKTCMTLGWKIKPKETEGCNITLVGVKKDPADGANFLAVDKCFSGLKKETGYPIKFKFKLVAG